MKNIKRIKINFLTYLFLILFIFSGYKSIVVYISLVFVVHEIGHLFFLIIFNIEISSFSIYPFGGIIKFYEGINIKFYKSLLINLGGILFQLILLLLNIIFFKNSYIKYYNNLFLFINLIPIIPFDGSKLLLLISSKLISYHSSRNIYIFSSIFLFICLLIYQIKVSSYNIMYLSFIFFKIIDEVKNNQLFIDMSIIKKHLKNHRKFVIL